MVKVIFLFALVTAVVSWDCEYQLGNIYKYQYNTELRNNVKEKYSHSGDIYGLSFGGDVTLIPLEDGDFLVQIYIAKVLQNNMDGLYGHMLDHSTSTAVFNEASEIIRVPVLQSVHGTNILRGVISALKVKSCQHTGLNTVNNEVSITGKHASTYESSTVKQLLLDGHVLFPVQESLNQMYDETESVISTTRRVRHLPNLRFTGSTSSSHKGFLNSVIQNGTEIEYSYIMGSGKIVQSCVLYEEYAPRHIAGFATNSHISVRTTLSLVSVEKDPESTHLLPLEALQRVIGREFESKTLTMEHILSDLRPDSGFSEAARDLGRLVKQGYDTTSAVVLQEWLSLVRNLNIGISTEEGRSEFGRVIDHSVLPWLIDAANVNGTAQMHLLAHSSIKTNRAQKLTERFILTKQFASHPPLRMLRWLLKTCGIERYKGACALALASSATNSNSMDPSNANVMNSVYQFLVSNIEKASSSEDKSFFIRSLENFKFPEAVQYLLRIATSNDAVEMRRVAVETLFSQDYDQVTYQDRQVLLQKAMSETSTHGATALHYVLTTAALKNLKLLIKSAAEQICMSGSHPLATFLHQILADLAQSHTNQYRSTIYEGELSRLQSSCQMCTLQTDTLPPDWIARRLAFGSRLLGGELRYTRYAGQRPTTGTSTLSLKFLERFGIKADVLQTMVDFPDLSTFANDHPSNPALLHVAVDGKRIKPIPFMMGDKEGTDSNVLLADISVIIPTLSGIPLSYSLAGTLRTESLVFTRHFPLVEQRHNIGILLQSNFKLAGSSLGWTSVTNCNIKYREEADFSAGKVLIRTYIEHSHFKTDTLENGDKSDLADLSSIAAPLTLLNATFPRQPQLAPHLVYCQEPTLPSLSIDDAIPFNPYSYLGKWLQSENSLSAIYPSTLRELPELDCDDPVILRNLHVEEGKSVRQHVTLHVQSLYGLFGWQPHSRVASAGSERSLRFQGELGDVVKVARSMLYYALQAYVGPDVVSVVLEGSERQQTLNLLLYSQCL